MEILKNGFLTNDVFILGDGEIETNSFSRVSSELAKFKDKIHDKYDDHPSM